MAAKLECLEDDEGNFDNVQPHRTILVQSDSRKSLSRSIDAEKVLSIIRRSKIVDEISAKFRQDRTSLIAPDVLANDGRVYLRLDVVGGRAFVDFIEPVSQGTMMTCCLRFEGQRLRTRRTPCACEPTIGDTFLFDLHKDGKRRLREKCSPVSISVIKTDPNGLRTILSSVTFDWREVLAMEDGRAAIALELLDMNRKFPIGILDLKIRITPSAVIDSRMITKNELKVQIKSESDEREEHNEKFRKYAQIWWQEYLSIRKSHAHRLVKIFARDICGEHLMVSLFVEPILECCRVLDTAHKALRFVSLVPVETTEKSETWMTPSVLLDSGKGDQKDHCILLCSLLIGLGLNAFVSIGTGIKGEVSTWVVTLGSNQEVSFWDVIQGNRYSVRPSVSGSELHTFHTIDCLFNDRSFHANCQPSNCIPVCNFDVSDGTLWKSMSSESIQSISYSNRTWTLVSGGDIDPNQTSRELETKLKSLITQHRQNLSLNTIWNYSLGVILGPALTAYENEKQTGQMAETRDFVEAVNNAVPDGHTFKGFPMNACHVDSRRIFSESLRSDIFKDIVSCRGDGVQFAVHAKVHIFPENVISVWIMFAVTYLSIP